MAKSTGKKKGKGKGKGKKKSSMGINTSRLMGMAGGVFADKKFLNEKLTGWIEDPKMRAVAKIALGEFAPKQDFVKNFMKDQEILDGAGAAFSVHGIDELFAEMNIAGMGAVSDDDSLAVVLDGIDDMEEDDMDEDIDTVNEDIDTVNEDVLGEDVLGEDDDDDMY